MDICPPFILRNRISFDRGRRYSVNQIQNKLYRSVIRPLDPHSLQGDVFNDIVIGMPVGKQSCIVGMVISY